MEYNIYKHRRGTTAEWLEIDLVPEDGELVIEECSNGFRKFKIGNGQAPFSKLPYADIELQNKLLAKITALEAELTDKLAVQNQELSESITQSEASLESFIKDQLNLIITDYNKQNKELSQAINVSVEKLENQTNTAYTSLKAQLNSKADTATVATLSNITDKHELELGQLANQFTEHLDVVDASLSDIADNVNISIKEATDQLSIDIENSYTKLDETYKTLKARLDAFNSEYTAKINQIDTNVTTLRNQVIDNNVNITQKLAELQSDLELADSVVTSSLEQLRNSTEETMADLLSKYNQLVTATTKLTEQDSSQNASIKALSTKLADTAKTLTTAIDSQIQHHQHDFAFLYAEYEVLTKTFLSADLDLSNTLQDHIVKTYEYLNELVENDVFLYKKTVVLEVSLTAELKNIYNNLNARITELDNKLSTELAETSEILSANILYKYENLLRDIDKVNSVLSSKLSSISANYTKLADKVDKNNTELLSKISTLNATIVNNNKAVNKDLTTLKKQTSDAALDIENLYTDLNTQANRIDTLVTLDLPTGSLSAGDRELLDIRNGYDGVVHTSAGEAVREVGKDVRALRDSLAQYVDTQAIDGLRYDYAGETGLMQPYMLYLTADGEVIQESGVQIISGSGGGGNAATSSLKLGYITKSPVIATTTDKVILKFTFSGTDGSGDALSQANATWKVNGAVVAYGTVVDGDNEFDITKYLSIGTTKVLLSVTDDNGGIVTKTWSIQQIELSVDSYFDDKLTYTAQEEIIFSYIPQGAIEKTAVFRLDGKEIERIKLSADISGREARMILPPQEHGSHLLEFYLEAELNGECVYSEHRFKDILWYDQTAQTPVISASPRTLTVKQYSTASILYTVYDPLVEAPEVTVMVDGKEVSSVIIRPNTNYNNTPTSVYSYTESTIGLHSIKIICGDTVKEIIAEVESLGIDIQPITAGLAFDFNPVGRNNADIDNRLWEHNGTKLSVSDNFDWINGGYIQDDPDGPCFCIKAGSTATIDYKLFADDAKRLGKEVKLVFKTTNVSNPEATFLTCLDNTTSKDHIGLAMNVHSANIYGQSGKLDLDYSENDVIEFEFNISTNTEKVPMVMGYEDGVPSRPMVYDNTYSFTQNTPQVITIGSADCDVYIYRFKVYNTSLSNVDILNNFIADARTAEDMIARYTRNQIYDENNKITPETLAEKCPWLRVYKVSAPRFTSSKSDKVADSVIQQIYKNGDPVLDNWTCYNAQHSGQGTSSNNYGAAGRNLDFIMNTDTAYFTLGDGSIANTVTLTRQSVPVAYLNAKVNIASSNNLTNAILANRYNKFNPYKRPFVTRDGIKTEYIKDTMEFHNCVIFIQETDPDLTTHREFADTDWHFYAIGNIGDSKKTDNTRATDPDDAYECCVEIMDVGLPLSDFPANTMIDAMSYSVDEKTGERVYTWAKNENLNILYELINGEYVKTADTEVDYAKTYYVDILENDDFSEDFTYGWRYLKNKKDAEAVAYCKQKWIEFYRFVTTSTDADFKAKLGDYFVIESALYYYLFTTRYCMVDNRAKNTFWHYGKTSDGTRKWDLCWDYDNDTSLGLNNYGKQVYRYGLEDIDRDEAGEEVFRESDSTFFCRLRDLFASELKTMYKNLETQNAWQAASFLATCDDWQNEFPEELWRLDIDRKYIRTYTSSFINGKGDSQFLMNMCNGRMKYHRRQWERNQEQYMASKYQTNRASGDLYHANFRVNRFESTDNLVIKPNYQLTLTPYSYMYLNVWYGDVTRTPFTVRAIPNQPTTVPCPSSLEADIINVGSASCIRDFGDLSACYPKTASIGNASRIKKLVLGNETAGYDNNDFSSLTTNTNPLLEEINVENISSLSHALDLQQLTNLKTIKAFGTSIPSVTFAEGGKISYVELPALNSIILKDLSYLSTTNFNLSDYSNVTSLVIEGCDLIDQITIFNRCPNLLKARLDKANFGYVTYDYFKTNLFKLKGVSAIGEDTTNAVLIGSANFNYLTGAQFNELSSRYKDLTLIYDQLDSLITFKDIDHTTILLQDTVSNAADYRDPVFYGEGNEIPDGMIAKPTKESTAEFDYEFFGWATEADIVLPADKTADYYDTFNVTYKEDCFKRVEGDRVLYPVFKAIRRSYKVQFVVKTNSDAYITLYTTEALYGSDAIYNGELPIKQDTPNPESYVFRGWLPTTENITGPRTCVAQFEIADSEWLTIGLADLINYQIPNPDKNEPTEYFDGYTLNDSNKTMSITGCANRNNVAIEVPSQMSFAETEYSVTGIGGFRSHAQLDKIKLPSTSEVILDKAFLNCTNLTELLMPADINITNIGSRAFESCYRLTHLIIPEKVSSIAEDAFRYCNSLALEIAEGNETFLVDNYCLIDKSKQALLFVPSISKWQLPDATNYTKITDYCFYGLSLPSISIPDGVVTLGAYTFAACPNLCQINLPGTIKNFGTNCFQNSGLESITIPNTISSIPSYCFNNCKSLQNVVLPKDLLGLAASCFSKSGLVSINLTELTNITSIPTYCFDSTNLSSVIIPRQVKTLSEHAFGNMTKLTEVTFMPNFDEQGNFILPYIHPRAFRNSGTATNPVVFNFPWSKEEHLEAYSGTWISSGKEVEKTIYFEATNAILNFDCEV